MSPCKILSTVPEDIVSSQNRLAIANYKLINAQIKQVWNFFQSDLEIELVGVLTKLAVNEYFFKVDDRFSGIEPVMYV